MFSAAWMYRAVVSTIPTRITVLKIANFASVFSIDFAPHDYYDFFLVHRFEQEATIFPSDLVNFEPPGTKRAILAISV